MTLIILKALAVQFLVLSMSFLLRNKIATWFNMHFNNVYKDLSFSIFIVNVFIVLGTSLSFVGYKTINIVLILILFSLLYVNLKEKKGLGIATTSKGSAFDSKLILVFAFLFFGINLISIALPLLRDENYCDLVLQGNISYAFLHGYDENYNNFSNFLLPEVYAGNTPYHYFYNWQVVFFSGISNINEYFAFKFVLFPLYSICIGLYIIGLLDDKKINGFVAAIISGIILLFTSKTLELNTSLQPFSTGVYCSASNIKYFQTTYMYVLSNLLFLYAFDLYKNKSFLAILLLLILPIAITQTAPAVFCAIGVIFLIMFFKYKGDRRLLYFTMASFLVTAVGLFTFYKIFDQPNLPSYADNTIAIIKENGIANAIINSIKGFGKIITDTVTILLLIIAIGVLQLLLLKNNEWFATVKTNLVTLLKISIPFIFFAALVHGALLDVIDSFSFSRYILSAVLFVMVISYTTSIINNAGLAHSAFILAVCIISFLGTFFRSDTSAHHVYSKQFFNDTHKLITDNNIKYGLDWADKSELTTIWSYAESVLGWPLRKFNNDFYTVNASCVFAPPKHYNAVATYPMFVYQNNFYKKNNTPDTTLMLKTFIKEYDVKCFLAKPGANISFFNKNYIITDSVVDSKSGARFFVFK